MAEQTVNTGVKQSLADLSDDRVADRAGKDYPRHFWSSAKNGHYRFALAGIAIESVIGAVIGTAVAALVGWAAAPAIIIAFAGTAALMGADAFGATGSAAAARASALAEKHARILDTDATGQSPLKAIDDKLMDNGRGHDYEFAKNNEKSGGLFSLKSGLAGAGFGGVLGALLGAGGIAANIPAVAGIAAAVPALGIAAAGAVAFGLFGLTFGIERKVLKSIFNQTDADTQGSIAHVDGPDLGRIQSPESDYALAQHRLRRQADVERLEKIYNEKISWGALTGRFRGFAGIIPSVLIGAATGALVLGVLALAHVALVAAAAAAVIPVFAVAGGALGMKVFTEAGMEAGAEATARAIDNEFERNRDLRAQGITPPAPKSTQDTWLSPKTALIMGVAGAAVGAAISIVVGPAAVALIPAAAHVAAGSYMGISALIGGMVGGSYGLGNKTLKAIANPFTSIYDKVVYNHNDRIPEIERIPAQQVAPLPLAPAYEKISVEDAALLNERLAAGSGKNFAQTAQQMQAAPASLATGV